MSGKKRKALTVSLACILLACIIVIAFVSVSGKRPYKDLAAHQIALATVKLSPPDRTILITEPKELVSYLQEVVTYREDNSYSEYNGQGVIFTLNMTDGTQTTVIACNPFLIIDGVGYRTKYEPCQALSSYANKLLNNKNSHFITEEPPGLAVVCGNSSFDTILGSYSWEKRNVNGTTNSTIADGAHPLDLENELLKFETEESTASLNFIEPPEKILSVRCWSDKYFGDSSAVGEEASVNGYELELKPGGYIYEIKAQWDTSDGYGGTASYSMYIYKYAY